MVTRINKSINDVIKSIDIIIIQYDLVQILLKRINEKVFLNFLFSTHFISLQFAALSLRNLIFSLVILSLSSILYPISSILYPLTNLQILKQPNYFFPNFQRKSIPVYCILPEWL